jgi:uncharacterized protein
MTHSLNLLPAFGPLTVLLTPLELPFSLSQLHGLICAYICASHQERATSFIHALVTQAQRPVSQEVKTQLFELLTVSEHQIQELEFGFQMLLPDEYNELTVRAQAFSEWCEGFLQGLQTCHIRESSFEDLEARETLMHFQDFAQLDYENLSVSEEDEKAFVEIYEYARLAVLQIKTACEDLQPKSKEGQAKH